MEQYCVSTLIPILMDCCAETQINAGRMVLDPIATHTSVNVNVDGKMITNLMKHHPVHPEIRNALARKEVIDYAKDKIIKEVIPKIIPFMLDDTCQSINNILKKDTTVSESVRKKLQAYADDGNTNEFYPLAIFYALAKKNELLDEQVQEMDFVFLQDSAYRCPIEGNRFWKKKKSAFVPAYKIVRIYPEELDDSIKSAFDAIRPAPKDLEGYDNKIALCLSCANSYLKAPTPEEYQRLLAKKAHLTRNGRKDEIAEESHLEDEIVDVIKAIASVGKKTKLPKFKDVLKVREKIRNEFSDLEADIVRDVNKYYPFIEDQFSILDGNGKNTFDVTRAEVKACYEKYKAEGYDQLEIYYALEDWILMVKGLNEAKHRRAAGVMVSFFVQNCAVFRKLKPNGEEDEEDEDEAAE